LTEATVGREELPNQALEPIANAPAQLCVEPVEKPSL
jgi:hypothetical protein